MVMVMVGALLVSGVETVWNGVNIPKYASRPLRRDFRGQGIRLERFAEMARFNYGSTVIMLFPRDGVTLTLNSTSLTPVTVKVAAKSADRNAIEQALNKFVTGYNTLLGKLNPMISYDAVQKQGGALLGESSARLLSQQLRTLLVSKIAIITGGTPTVTIR